MVETQQINIYEMGDGSEEYIAAKSAEDAVNEHYRLTGELLDNGIEDVILINDATMQKFTVRDEDGEDVRTFAEEVQYLITSGVDFPCYFASGNV